MRPHGLSALRAARGNLAFNIDGDDTWVVPSTTPSSGTTRPASVRLLPTPATGEPSASCTATTTTASSATSWVRQIKARTQGGFAYEDLWPWESDPIGLWRLGYTRTTGTRRRTRESSARPTATGTSTTSQLVKWARLRADVAEVALPDRKPAFFVPVPAVVDPVGRQITRFPPRPIRRRGSLSSRQVVRRSTCGSLVESRVRQASENDAGDGYVQVTPHLGRDRAVLLGLQTAKSRREAGACSSWSPAARLQSLLHDLALYLRRRWLV